ncbi:GNAT family N-acetyltransferase [Arenimonas terrae]|jgi:RimJ/RimL family protein N-acetyltransferase|uniref:N-acetyltransferase n=1 Tax=Arenimonas terrae TaxID=2546226 RepID=A0A5C4RY94_9GAMM|nr:GNAT family N-acetyltransferase [Arenimonas terrae]TNJ35651.1 N-acetyltransferase [Arenimonas terrae]
MNLLVTSRLQLRPLAGEDGDSYVALYGNVTVMRHVRPPLAEPEARRSFSEALRQQREVPPRRRWWTLQTPDGTETFGLAGLAYAGVGAELGILLRPAWQGRGLASEAVRALCAYAFREQALSSISARHGLDNRAAHRLFAHAGFEPAAAPPGERHWALAAPSPIAGGCSGGAANPLT